MSETLRKNITISKKDYETIKSYIGKTGQSFSEFLSLTAIKQIEKQEQMDLLTYLNNNCSFVSKKEQKEIDSLNIDYSNTEGEELSLDGLLQD